METEKVIIHDSKKPYSVGTFVRHGTHGLPIVKIDGIEYMSCSIIIPYSKEMVSILDKKTPQEQWEFLSSLTLGIQKFRKQPVSADTMDKWPTIEKFP